MDNNPLVPLLIVAFVVLVVAVVGTGAVSVLAQGSNMFVLAIVAMVFMFVAFALVIAKSKNN